MGYYNKIAEGYDELYKDEQLHKLQIIKDNIEVKGKLLDVGCGTGIAYEFFNVDYTGIDPSEELLKQCKGKSVLGKAEELPFENESFDVVIAVTSLHHCDLDKAVSEIKRVVKKNGVIVISFLKKSEKLSEIKKLLKDFKQIDEGKDIIFIQTY